MSIASFIYELHIITGMITFLIGPLQFISRLRESHAHLHRLLGKTYIINVLVSSVTGFVISFRTPLWLVTLGTSSQCVLWFSFTLLAYFCIRRHKVAAHRRWMIRSYALVLSAPVVRICIVLLENFTAVNYMQNFEFYYPLFVWLSFLPLILAEVYVRMVK